MAGADGNLKQLVGMFNNTFGQQEAGGEIFIVAGGAHDDCDAAAFDAYLERLFRSHCIHDGLRRRTGAQARDRNGNRRIHARSAGVFRLKKSASRSLESGITRSRPASTALCTRFWRRKLPSAIACLSNGSVVWG